MKITVAAVTSLDGKLNRHGENDIQDWTSTEDSEHFRSLVDAHDAIVMGSTTYEAMRPSLRLQPGKLRIVLTTRSDAFGPDAVPGQLEFATASPSELVASLQARGYPNLLVAGGGRMIADFLAADLVDELYITVEPRIFGTGSPLIVDAPLDISLKLVESRLLNTTGTILLHYQQRES